MHLNSIFQNRLEKDFFFFCKSEMFCRGIIFNLNDYLIRAPLSLSRSLSVGRPGNCYASQLVITFLNHTQRSSIRKTKIAKFALLRRAY